MTEWKVYFKILLAKARSEHEIKYREIRIDPLNKIRLATVGEVGETIEELKKNGPIALFELQQLFIYV